VATGNVAASAPAPSKKVAQSVGNAQAKRSASVAQVSTDHSLFVFPCVNVICVVRCYSVIRQRRGLNTTGKATKQQVQKQVQKVNNNRLNSNSVDGGRRKKG
jgi:ribosomal protein S13